MSEEHPRWPVPASGSTFRAGPSTVTLGAVGTVTAVRHDSRPGWSYLGCVGQVGVQVAGEPVEWSDPELNVDADEVEITRRSAAGGGAAARLRAVVRHSFGAGWSVRLVLSNLGTEPVAIEDATICCSAPEDSATWALAAGAVGSYVVAPPDGRGPLLGGTLDLGAAESVTPEGLNIGPLSLDPGGRYVVQWHWSWYDSPREFAHRAAGRHGDRQVPRTLHLGVGETAAITAGEDEALVLAPGVVAEPMGDQTDLGVADSGTFRVEVCSARGVTHYDLHWVDPIEVVLRNLAEAALGGPRTAAGVVRLDTVDAAAAVQFALRLGLGEADAAEDALDLFTARSVDRTGRGDLSGLDPRTASFLCGEFDRTGDLDALEAATEAVLTATAVTPGLGLAASQVALARVLVGMPLTDLTARVAALAQASPPADADRIASPVATRAAAVEFAVLARARANEEVTAGVLALGSSLGAGLKGHPVRPLPVHTAAHLAAVLAGLGDEVSVGLRQHWPCTGHELGRWTESAVLARLTGAPLGPAHFWLAAAARTR